MIKRAITPEEKERSFNYLKDKGYIATTDLFYYADDFKAVAGVEICGGDTSLIGRIEPMGSDSIRASIELYEYVMNTLKMLGCKFVICTTNKEHVIKALGKKGHKVWGKNLTELIKQI